MSQWSGVFGSTTLWVHTTRLVGWEIEKESDMVKQKHGGVARAWRDMYRSAEETGEGRALACATRLRRPQTSQHASWAMAKTVGQARSAIAVSKRTDRVREWYSQSSTPQTKAAKGSAEK